MSIISLVQSIYHQSLLKITRICQFFLRFIQSNSWFNSKKKLKDVNASCWNEIPEDLQMEILADMPSNYWYRYRSVCHDWNAILSSKYFLTVLCGGDDPPLLLICNSNTDLPASTHFCFHTWTWETANIELEDYSADKG